MKLADQTILLTGGAGTLGKLVIANFYGNVNKLVLLDRDAEGLATVSKSHPEIHSYTCDLGDYMSVQTTIDQVFSDGHAVTVLINNAGYIHSEPLVNLMSRDQRQHSPETWLKTINDNLNSVFFVTSSVVEKMVSSRAKGLIINISSIAAAGNAGQSAYGAAKAGVNALTTIWSKELGMFGIRSAAVAPGFLDVPSTHNALTESKLKNWTQQTPIRRLGTIDEFIGALRFVIEDDFFNGRVLELDGGLRI